MSDNIIIIGNGIAANSAADTIRRANNNVNITMISDEKYSLYSPCVLPHYLSNEIDEEILYLKNMEDYSKNNINFISGVKVTEIIPANKIIRLENKKKHKYDRLIVATGSKPIIPPVKGYNLNGVFTLKSMDDVESIEKFKAKTAVVVGSGLVGVEGAAALKEKGYEVYLVELLDRIMPKNFNTPLSLIIEDIMEKNGINVFTGEKVLEICGENKVNKVKTDKRKIECDLVIFATGMKPNTKLAEKAGIETGKLGGIRTNTRMQTNIRDIYACGDCVESPDVINSTYSLNLLWGFAQKQGEVAGSNCVGIKKNYFPDLPSVGTKLFETPITSIGKVADENDDSYSIIKKNLDKKFSLVILKNDIIIGAQMIGEVEDIGLFSSIIRNRLKKDEVEKLFSGKNIDLLNPTYYKLKNIL